MEIDPGNVTEGTFSAWDTYENRYGEPVSVTLSIPSGETYFLGLITGSAGPDSIESAVTLSWAVVEGEGTISVDIE